MNRLSKQAVWLVALAAAATTALCDVPMKSWGKPDLQGTWDFRSITPFQRPEYFKDKEYVTVEERAEFEKSVRDRRAARAENKEFTQGQGDVDVGYNAFFLDQGTKMTGTMRTSLVIDPPNGRLPPMKEAASERMAGIIKLQERSPIGPEDRNFTDRCILGFNAGPPMTPGAYNNIMEIVQTEDYVAILVEMVNDHRVIPTHGGEALPEHMRLWKGDSRGVWEGDTFVVTTTNFNRFTNFRGTTPEMVLTERFTRTGEDTLLYQYTVDDPNAYEATWTSELEMQRTDDLVYEYACHEGNYAMPLMLKGARKLEAQGLEDDNWLPSWHKRSR